MKKIFLIIGIVLLSIFGISIFQEFMANHTYYAGMLASWANWKLIIWMIIASMIPLRYILKSKTFDLKKFFIWILPLGLVVASVAHTVIKEGIVGGPAGFIILCVNTLILYFLGMYFILGCLSLGTWISKKWIKFSEIRWQEMFLTFGIGIGILLLALYVLSMLTIMFPLVTWILALGLGYMIWYMRKDLVVYKELIVPMFDDFKLIKIKENQWKWIGLILLGVAIMYYFYGFNLSFVPYSTAWDANHQYMYVPKVLAENHGVLRGNMGAADTAQYLWHMFIAFRFSLIQPIKSRFWLSPDTIAVAMNFLSGLFVLFFGMGLVDEVLGFFGKKNENEQALSFNFGRLGLLFWLTSGMGAFLVFVDNKTDLGVMAMTILAILSGFIFLKVVSERLKENKGLDKQALKYVIVSGIFFALASMSKPTAFIDIALFGLLLVGLWIDEIMALGLGFMAIGAMGILKVGNAPDLMNAHLGTWIFGIGAVILAVGLIRLLQKHGKRFLQERSHYLRYIGIWLITLVAVLVVFKGPNILIGEINTHTFSPSTWVKGILLGKQQPSVLLASSTPTTQLIKQTQTDQATIDQNSSSLSLASCKTQTFSSGDLHKNLKVAVMGNEDVGRYVGYGWKELSDTNGLSLGYYILRMAYPMNNTCYGVNHDAKLLCQNATAIDSFDINRIKILFAEVKKGGTAYTLLSGAIAAYQVKAPLFTGVLNPAEFRDQIVALRQYYQNHIIYTQAGKIEIPYRYIVPLNVIFNRSLQNLSSYYTDIGFIWLFMLLFIIMGFVYALIKKEKNLTVLAGTTIIGRAVWWTIGGGIVWYGIGLIMWTILTTALFIKELANTDEEKNYSQNAFYVFICLFVVWAVVQLVLNFVRISSQGGSGPFERYKMGYGKTTEINNQLQQQPIDQSNYGWKSVFDLQFPHYNKLIDAIKDRPNTDGVLIAGTYIQYFLANQHNIKFDGMLDWFRTETSDDNSCKSYQRLQESHIKYMVIDPNIGTVGMGEGNESLFNRFFAKVDPVTNKITEQGAISRLVQLRKDGYISLFSTNNLGAKYAFTMSDQALETAFGPMDADALLLLRAKITIARFFPNESQKLIEFIANTFTQRLNNGDAIGDIADVYGKTIDESKVMQAAVMMIKQTTDTTQLQNLVISLNQDERLILSQYVGLVNLAKAQNTQYQDYLNSLLGQSLGGGSQLIVFELN
ncbi:MAG: hypothetical protein NTX91_01065 [candidate division SR1 bacterium]|nr:hypothetical protein [candidate division SR1 bacterium]